jgi:hypothetical protein
MHLFELDIKALSGLTVGANAEPAVADRVMDLISSRPGLSHLTIRRAHLDRTTMGFGFETLKVGA